MKRFLLIGFLALAGCEGYDSSGAWRDGIPSTSGYYVDPVRSCIRIGQMNNGMSGYHAARLAARIDAGERMCDRAGEDVLALARRLTKG